MSAATPDEKGYLDLSNETPAVESDPVSELTINFSETAQILFSAGSVFDTLASVVDLAVATIDGCDYAGLFLIEGDLVNTPVHTNPIVVEVDTLQHLTGEGPCLDAITQQVIFYAEDVGTDERWSHFGPRARAAGIRSLLALPLSDEARRGALNLYARYPSAFGVVDRGKAVILTSLATLALSAAHLHENQERRAENLHLALRTREIDRPGRRHIDATRADFRRRGIRHFAACFPTSQP